MSSAATATSIDGVLARLDAVLDELTTLPWDALAEDELLLLARRIEPARRRFAPVDHQLIAQLEQRSVAFTQGARSTAAMLHQLLRLAPGEAVARVKAAQAMGPRRTVTGVPVDPEFPVVAAAQAEGAISERHAQVVVRTIVKLPDAIADEVRDVVEGNLVQHAREIDPVQLDRFARELAYALDQDGQLADDKHRERLRGVRVHRRADGSSRWEVEATAELTEHMLTAWDALARPVTTGGVPDPRTADQRRHDALVDLVKCAERATQLPATAGVTATIVLTMDAEAYASGNGTATTGHGTTIAAAVAKQWAGADARIMMTVLNRCRRVEAYSSSHRILTEGQRLALLARDRGCSFPGCTVQALWTEAHHVEEYQDDGPSSVDNCCLLCRFHHAQFAAMGWSCIMRDGRPEWIPPKWIDPERKPRRNTMHDILADARPDERRP